MKTEKPGEDSQIELALDFVPFVLEMTQLQAQLELQARKATSADERNVQLSVLDELASKLAAPRERMDALFTDLIKQAESMNLPVAALERCLVAASMGDPSFDHAMVASVKVELKRLERSLAANLSADPQMVRRQFLANLTDLQRLRFEQAEGWNKFKEESTNEKCKRPAMKEYFEHLKAKGKKSIPTTGEIDAGVKLIRKLEDLTGRPVRPAKKKH